MKIALMKWWACIAYAAGLAGLVVFLPGSARAPAAERAMDARIEDVVARNLAPAAADRSGGLAVAVYVAGRIRFFNYGFADQATKRTITPDTLFNLARCARCSRRCWSRSVRFAAN